MNINKEFLLIAPLATPFVFSILIWLVGGVKRTGLLYIVHALAAVMTAVFGLISVQFATRAETLTALNDFLFIDPVGAVFITIISIVGLLTNLYSIKYISWELESKAIEFRDARLFFALCHLFVFTMLLSVMSNNIVLMWAAVEATTLSSVFLVSLYRKKSSVEGGWKYIVICSIGLAFGLYGTILLYGSSLGIIGNAHKAMLWTSLAVHGGDLNPDVMKIIFVFFLIGYGTKAGLAPMHTWLPDAHAEGPSPASALLSAVLLKCAIAAIIRFYTVAVLSPETLAFVKTCLMIVGLVSIIIAALFILKQRDIKRMFAYSSTENIGIISVAMAFGGRLGLFAMFFHVMNHSLTKALAFCTSGNVQHIHGTRNMGRMGGLFKTAPVTAVLLAVAIFSLAGLPPMAIFTSEFYTVMAGVQAGDYLGVAILFTGLGMVFYGLVSQFNRIAFGEAPGDIKNPGEVSFAANLPLLALAVLVCTIGIFPPEWWTSLLNNAVAEILQNP